MTERTGAAKLLEVSIERQQLVIKIGIGLMAFAVQAVETTWPSDFYIMDVADWAQDMAKHLRREEEDGTTPVHRMLDAAAVDLIENGPDSVDQGPVERGIAIAETYMKDHPGEPPLKLSNAAADVLNEREDQRRREGFTPEHDDAHVHGEMAHAAAIYAEPPGRRIHWDGEPAPATWPWDPAWWKPTTHRRDLVKAGALIIAEIERLDRAAARTSQPDPEGE